MDLKSDTIQSLSDTEAFIKSFSTSILTNEDKDIKVTGQIAQEKLLHSYWTLKAYLDTLDVTGFPVKLLDEHHLYVPNRGPGVYTNLIKEFSGPDEYHTHTRTRTLLILPAGTLGVLIDIKKGYHLIGIYDAIADQFVIKSKLKLRIQDYTTHLDSEERAKVENARKKLIIRKYKKNNFKIISKLEETKA